jgi:hypothetical protein
MISGSRFVGRLHAFSVDWRRGAAIWRNSINIPNLHPIINIALGVDIRPSGPTTGISVTAQSSH